VRDALELREGSRAVVIGSEGATDAESYERVVGRSAAEVLGGLPVRAVRRG
jgi:diaminopropionate ammonia-lyase